jgi:hypothetical protein
MRPKGEGGGTPPELSGEDARRYTGLLMVWWEMPSAALCCYELFSGRSFGFFVVAGFFPNSRAEIMFCNQIAVNWS